MNMPIDRTRPAAGRAAMAAALLAGALVAGSPGAPRAEGAIDALSAYTVLNGREIPDPLGGVAGDPQRGRALFLDTVRTGCTACHAARAASGLPVGGYGTGGGVDARPAGSEGEARAIVPLDGVGQRLAPGEIRLWLVDPAAVDPGSAMPAYFLPGQRKGADDPRYNGPRLAPAEIEDLVAWLATLDGAP